MSKKGKEESSAVRAAKERLLWIERAKQKQGLNQKQAEALWAKIHLAIKCPECLEEKPQSELDDFGGLCENCANEL